MENLRESMGFQAPQVFENQTGPELGWLSTAQHGYRKVLSTAQHRILPAQNSVLALGGAALGCAVRWAALALGCAGECCAELRWRWGCAGAGLRWR